MARINPSRIWRLLRRPVLTSRGAFNLLAALSLLVALALAGLWLSSFRRFGGYAMTTAILPYDRTHQPYQLRLFSVESTRGLLHFRRMDLPEFTATFSRNGWITPPAGHIDLFAQRRGAVQVYDSQSNSVHVARWGWDSGEILSGVYEMPTRVWLITVPHWMPIGVAALLPALWVLRRVRRFPSGMCPSCGYDLRATPERCPECGAEPDLKCGNVTFSDCLLSRRE